MRQIISLAVLASLTLGLGACAELSSLKRSVFKSDKKAEKTFHNADTRSLRGTPNQSFVFDGSQDYDIVIYDTALSGTQTTRGNVHYYYSDHYYEMERRLGNPSYVSSNNYSVEIFDTSQNYITPTSYNSQSVSSVSTANSTPNISFVNNAGETNMADWVACEAKVGRYIVWQTSRYVVDPDFERCMRGKGYSIKNGVA